jgi:CheY-like chemotaxis protein
MGAIGIVQKPAAREMLRDALAKTRELIERDVKTLLVADGDEARRARLIEALSGEAVLITSASAGKQALEHLRNHRFDCVVLGPRLKDMTAIALLKTVAESGSAAGMPFVIYETESLAGAEQDNLRRLAEIVILKKAPTPEAVLEETTLFLHQAISSLPADKRRILESRQADPQLAGRKVLIVDDDVRNIFALTGALEQCGMTVFNADNGKEGIEILKSTPGINMVLMDIMMPELDGYDTIRIIRGQEQFRDLPIIAVTAKAMKEDREKCIDAGASDYIAKPVNVEQLGSLMRIWLNQ